MPKKMISSLTRRDFLKISSLCSVAAIIYPVSVLGDMSFLPVERNDLAVFPFTEMTSGFKGTLLNIAQVSDVHIIDPDHYLRAKNLKLLGLVELGPLLDAIPSTSRVQDHLTGLAWDAVIRSVNSENAIEPFDFLITTGDHTDTDLEHELRWFVEIADGIVPSDYKDRLRHGLVADISPQGLDVPWYAALGNHDVEYMGTFNSELLIGKLIDTLGSPDAKALSDLNESIDIYQDTLTTPDWHGFKAMPADFPKEGYYSFDPNPIVHCIVLNTANFNSEAGVKLETMSLGVVDKVQFAWMKEDIEAHFDKLCLVFSHHSPKEFSTLVGNTSNSKFVGRKAFSDTLCAYENVIAHINGHTHFNRIEAIKTETGGYWDINTCSIIEYPQEWRKIKLFDNNNGTGTLSCRMIQHHDQECIDTALSDPDAYPDMRRGTERDRDVTLLFNIPVSVKENIDANYNRLQASGKDKFGNSAIDSDAKTAEGEGKAACFIGTAV
ncbi:MAG: metallophosphoesterase [Proteobacteria bacterium]|nr:metallophosphoesterase [Pseudomonadota bacterium]